MDEYQRVRSTFKLEVPRFFNFGLDVMDKWAETAPTKLALLAIDEKGVERRYTFSEIKLLSNKFGNVLRSLKLEKGERVLVMLPNVSEWYIVMLGMIKLGIVPVPTTVQRTAEDLKYGISQSEATMVITDVDNASKIDTIKANCSSLRTLMVTNGQLEGWQSYEGMLQKASPTLPEVESTRSDDPMLLYFTSGSTGYAKMVIHTQASYGIGHVITAKFWQALKQDDLIWTISDQGWAKAAWGKFFGQWTLGSTIFLHNAKGKFDPELTLELIEKYGITTFCAPPTAYRILVPDNLIRYKLTGLRHCVSAGEPLDPEVIAMFEERAALKIYDGYGQTETVNVIANFRFMPVRAGSMGWPTPNFEVAVVDEEGNELPPGEEGYIAIKVKPSRPVGLFKEYWRDESEMARVFKGDWYYTGDKAYRDEEGYFWFTGRADDIIISAGYRIGPFEVESVLMSHPAVVETAVVASPDELRGKIVKAFIILAPGYSPVEELKRELQQYVKTKTAPFKYPRQIEFVESLPKTPNGKIKRGELRGGLWPSLRPF